MLDKIARTVRLHPSDNVIVSVDMMAPVSPSTTSRQTSGSCAAIRWRPFDAKGEPVRKFGQIIGFASQDIAAGAHVHEHNCTMGEFERDYAFARQTAGRRRRWTAAAYVPRL